MSINKSELACVYAALVLIDDDIDVTGEKIQTVLKAANIEVESYWLGMFAKASESANVKDLTTKIESAVGAVPAAGRGAAAAPAAEAKEEKKEEKKEESEEEDDEDMGFG